MGKAKFERMFLMKETASGGNLYILVGDIGVVFVDGEGEERASVYFRDVHRCGIVERGGERVLVLVTTEGSKEIGLGEEKGVEELVELINERSGEGGV
jgi:hypothetical protein